MPIKKKQSNKKEPKKDNTNYSRNNLSVNELNKNKTKLKDNQMKNENCVLDENKDKSFESSKSNKIINDPPSSRPFNTLSSYTNSNIIKNQEIIIEKLDSIIKNQENNSNKIINEIKEEQKKNLEKILNNNITNKNKEIKLSD